jgi:Phosphodiester glycosidase/FlgD Ig-like domain
MRRLLATAAVLSLAVVFAAPAEAAPRVLWPGVTYELGVHFTPRGPVAIHVLHGPRPGGLTTLEPVLSNETVVERETLTSMQRRLASQATAAGVNGDYFTFATGRPSGVLMRDGGLVTPPNAARASAGITTDGRLEVRRASFAGSWRGLGGNRVVRSLNAPPTADGSALYTDRYGPATPPLPGSVALVLFPFPTPTPEVDLVAPVVELRAGGGAVPIPAGGAVLLARGQSAAALTAETAVGATMTVRLSLRPTWPGVLSAFGGGPQLVRDGVPLYRSGEKFTTRQLGPRAPRSAVGQLADGRVVLVAVDGRQPGYSVGLTSFELAQALVRLGAVTGMGLDSGGSTTMAFDGTLLNRPSDGRERSISTGVMLLYRGVFAPEPPAVVSPNSDGVAESPELGYRIVRPSSVTVTVRAPGGAAPLTSTASQLPGTYPVPFPPTGGAPAPGKWSLEVSAVDDVGQASAITRTFVVDDTLGFLRVPRLRAVPPQGREIPLTWRLSRPARASVTVLDASGTLVRRLLGGARLVAGEQRVVWDGLGVNRRRLSGRYTVRVVAASEVGRSELTAPIVLRRAAAPGKR